MYDKKIDKGNVGRGAQWKTVDEVSLFKIYDKQAEMYVKHKKLEENRQKGGRNNRLSQWELRLAREFKLKNNQGPY